MPKHGRHELACSRCGAPLHDLKMLPVAKTGDRELIRYSPIRTAKSHNSKKPKKKSPKRNKSKNSFKFLKNAFEEAFDFIEDIFD
ncbi:hypothetical protein N9P81_00940 [bacterium]|nr:hypothetical protein [bacterium]